MGLIRHSPNRQHSRSHKPNTHARENRRNGQPRIPIERTAHISKIPHTMTNRQADSPRTRQRRINAPVGYFRPSILSAFPLNRNGDVTKYGICRANPLRRSFNINSDADISYNGAINRIAIGRVRKCESVIFAKKYSGGGLFY